MSELIKDGGPAFPTVATECDIGEANGERQVFGNTYSYGGMTLRDWFAGQAACAVYCKLQLGIIDTDVVAKAAYAIADSMLAERERNPE